MTASSDYLGEVEPLGYGLWRWPFKKMTEGSYFTVREDQKPVGAVRQYAYSEGARLGKRFIVTTDGETITVTCEPKPENGGRLPSEIAADKALFVEGDGEQYLGILVPPDNGARWSWPFGRMEPGQYFHVAHADRHPERVRQLAMVRAACLAIQISVCANDPARPGHARIEYVDVATKAANPDLTFDMTNALLARCYDMDLHSMPANAWSVQPSDLVAEGRTYRVERPQIAAPKQTSFMLKMESYRIGFELDKDGFTLTGLNLDRTYREWKMMEALA